jgi:hypothetical protein
MRSAIILLSIIAIIAEIFIMSMGLISLLHLYPASLQVSHQCCLSIHIQKSYPR